MVSLPLSSLQGVHICLRLLSSTTFAEVNAMAHVARSDTVETREPAAQADEGVIGSRTSSQSFFHAYPRARFSSRVEGSLAKVRVIEIGRKIRWSRKSQ